ncbi:GAD-like domain-containing protein [Chitinolyticbacter meiyuanensis]|uniref:GAD-like domain-containing protein n=1 Tax=Chitinolyticbacter meiyuanensis TaxID=682798 RepID=UPI0016525646|nr:GAD-like domain-containing protein [Chitinolyticbacter meiyuanensis]
MSSWWSRLLRRPAAAPGTEALSLQPFLECHAPTDVRPASTELVARYRGLLPEPLLTLWQRVGLGRYGNGLITLVNPDDYKHPLYGWLMYDEENPSRLPIAVTAFGLLIYYRRLDEDAADVAYIDPNLREAGVLAWSLEAAFNDVLCSTETQAELLDAELFAAAFARLGPLKTGQSYCFVPALALGGAKVPELLEIGDAAVQLDLLLQLANAE